MSKFLTFYRSRPAEPVYSLLPHKRRKPDVKQIEAAYRRQRCVVETGVGLGVTVFVKVMKWKGRWIGVYRVGVTNVRTGKVHYMDHYRELRDGKLQKLPILPKAVR